MSSPDSPSLVPTVYAIHALRLIDHGGARGLDARELVEIAGEPMEDLARPGHHIAVQRLCDLFGHIMRALDDPGLPYTIARQIRMEDLHVMGFAVMTATDGREATRRAVRYARLISTNSQWELIEGPDDATIRLERYLGPRLGHRVINEAALADFVHCSRACSGYDYTPLRVAFCHREPPDTRPHREFFRCDVEFNAPHNEFVIDNGFFDYKPVDANPAMSQFFRDHAEKLLREQNAGASLSDQVRREIARQLPSGPPTLASVARRLATSERSLRRHLTADGTSFSQLLSDVRFERARSLLRSSETSLSDVAYLLGFSNVSAFSRAFKKWCGSAPGEFRAAGG